MSADDGHSCALHWADNNCGWEIYNDYTLSVATTPNVCDDCSDYGSAIDYLFATEITDALVDTSMCTVAHFWLEAQSDAAGADDNGSHSYYCQNQLFEALCPVTCATSCNVCKQRKHRDNNDAAAIIVTMLDISATGATSCEKLKNANYLSDQVVQQICPQTYTIFSRRLSAGRVVDHPAMPSVGDIFFSRLNINVTDPAAFRRRLDTPTGLVAYQTQYPISKNPTSNCPSADNAPATYDLNAQTVYDMKAWQEPYKNTIGQDVTITRHCPVQTDAVTFEGRKACMASDKNMDRNSWGAVGSASYEAIIQYACYDRCAPQSTGAGQSTDPLSVSGFDHSMSINSAAICARAEVLLDLCALLDDCVGVEVHRTKSLGYLNMECGEDLQNNENFDFYTPGQEALIKFDTLSFVAHGDNCLPAPPSSDNFELLASEDASSSATYSISERMQKAEDYCVGRTDPSCVYFNAASGDIGDVDLDKFYYASREKFESVSKIALSSDADTILGFVMVAGYDLGYFYKTAASGCTPDPEAAVATVSFNIISKVYIFGEV